jgi:hypothetical protein
MRNGIVITLEIVLGVIVLKTFHAKSHITCITPVHSVLPFPMLLTQHTISGLAFFAGGGSLLLKCLSVS